jgi:hypothetical protein
VRVSFKVSRSVFRGTDEEESFKATLESLGIPLRVTSFVKTPNALVVQVDAVRDEALLVKLLDELGYPVGIISSSSATSTRDALSDNSDERTPTNRVPPPRIDAPVRTVGDKSLSENSDPRRFSGLINPLDLVPKESTAKSDPAPINNTLGSPPPITRHPPVPKAPTHISEKVTPPRPPAMDVRSISPPPPVRPMPPESLSPRATGMHRPLKQVKDEFKAAATSERTNPASERPSRGDHLGAPLSATQRQSVQVAPVFADNDDRAPEPTRSESAATINSRAPRPESRQDAIHHEATGYDKCASAEPNRRNVVIIASAISLCLAAAGTYFFRADLKNFYDNYRAINTRATPISISRPEFVTAAANTPSNEQLGSQKNASVATQKESKDITRPAPQKTTPSSQSKASPSENGNIKMVPSTKEPTRRAETDAVGLAEVNADPSVPKVTSNITSSTGVAASTTAGGVDVTLRSVSAELNRVKTQSFSEFRAQKLESDLGLRRGRIRESDYDIVEPIKLSLCVRPDGSVDSVTLINGGGNSRRLLKLVEQWSKRTSWQWINGSVSSVQCGVSLTVV